MASAYSDEPFVLSFPEFEPEAESNQLTNSQSLAVVQTFLNAAVACIAYTRELIPWASPCFQIRYVGQLEIGILTDSSLYQSFCDQLEPQCNDQTQEFRVLRRGIEPRADSILDVLENGVHEAIKLGYLEAIRIFVTVNENDPAAVLESYTFAFQYDEQGVSQVQLSSQSKDAFSVKAIKKSFTNAVRALLRGLKDLRPLPRQRKLGFSLTFNDTCPTAYQPAGFVDINDHQPEKGRVSWASVWQGNSPPFADFSTGKHIVHIGAQSLAFSQNLLWSQMQGMNASAPSQNMYRMSSPSRNSATLVTAAIPNQSVLQSRRTAAAPALRQTNGHKKAQGAKRKSPDDKDDLVSQKRATRSEEPVDVKIFESSIKTKNSLKTLTVRAKNRRRRNVVPSKLAELIVQARAMENEHDGDKSLFDQAALKVGAIVRVERSGDVECECTSTHEDNDMMFCELCGTFQHKNCYGYVGLRPGGLPEEHFCYNCLLLPREQKVNDSMPGLVHMRLALTYLAQQEYARIEIDNALHTSVIPKRKRSATDFMTILNRLCAEGYITMADDGFLETIATPQKIEEGQTAYLDPLAGITQHYEILKDGEGPKVRKANIQTALKSYFGKRDASYNDETNSAYDHVVMKDNAAKITVRWGFYGKWKPEGQLNRLVLGKASIGDQFINIDRSTPSDGLSLHEALTDTVNEADWLLRERSRISPM